MTGMRGVYLAAAELTHQGLIVSVTSRNARGADLFATDQAYKRTWSIQVKTSAKSASYWLLGNSYKEEVSSTHVYIFVTLRGDDRPEFYVVPSRDVAKNGETTPPRASGSVWHLYRRSFASRYRDKWSLFKTIQTG